MPSTLFISGSTSRGTAISIKNMGLLRRSAMSFSPCSRRKMKCGEPVEVITMSARAQGAYSPVDPLVRSPNFFARPAEEGGGAGRGNHDVGAIAGVIQPVELDCLSVKFLRQPDGAVEFNRLYDTCD